VVTPDDFRRLSQSLNEYHYGDLQIKLAIHMLWDTGMRVSELTDLKLSDINDPNEEGIRTAQLISKKSARYNLVAWSKETDELLCMYLGVRLSENNSTDALLVDRRRKRTRAVNVRTIQRWVKDACKKAGITKAISPHSFRHGKAHNMLNNGANIRDVQAVLRHINPITTFHYLAMNQKQFLEVAGRHLNPLTP
jgi:site-specific recombinase XerD